MLKNKPGLSLKPALFSLLGLGGLIVLLTMACGSVGVYDPQATQVAMQGTVSALQVTIAAMEATNSAPATSGPPSPQIIVVTATPSDTPTPLPSPTPTPASALSDALPGQPVAIQGSATPATVAQNQTVVVIITATPVPSPTPKNYSEAPILITPLEGAIVEEQREIVLQWSWNGLLGPNEYFDIKIRPDGQTRSAYIGWERSEGHTFKANLAPGRYYWSVQVLQGYYKNNSGEPEDRVFEAFLSPESEPRLIIVAEKPEPEKKKTPTPPTSQSQADPPGPAIPYGLATGGLAFAAFAAVTTVSRRRTL